MKITQLHLRNIIKEEISALYEDKPGSAAPSGEGASSLSDQQKKQLSDLSKSLPSNLAGLSKNLKILATIVDDVDSKAANINSSQLGNYWGQIMSIISGLMSDEKTSASATGKVSKALGA